MINVSPILSYIDLKHKDILDSGTSQEDDDSVEDFSMPAEKERFEG